MLSEKETKPGSPNRVPKSDELFLKYGLDSWDRGNSPEQIEENGYSFILDLNKETFPLKLKNQLIFSPNEKKPQYNIDIENHLSYSSGEKKEKTGRLKELELISRYEKIISSKKTLLVYKHLLNVGCSTMNEIEYDLDISMATVQRAITRLENQGFIFRVHTIRRKGVNGSPPVVFGVEGYTKNDLDRAITRNLRRATPIYQYVDIIAQKTLSEYGKEIAYLELVQKVKPYSNKGFRLQDLIEEVSKELTREGVKIYR